MFLKRQIELKWWREKAGAFQLQNCHSDCTEGAGSSCPGCPCSALAGFRLRIRRVSTYATFSCAVLLSKDAAAGLRKSKLSKKPELRWDILCVCMCYKHSSCISSTNLSEQGCLQPAYWYPALGDASSANCIFSWNVLVILEWDE